jgi:two-component system, HptB-dependent secretion and biofilm response regulator
MLNASPTLVRRMERTYTVLIADDSKHIRYLLRHLVATLGYTPVMAEDGEEALQLFTTVTPDLVLLDVMMPKLNGYEVAQRIRSQLSSSWVPIIFLSAASEEENEIQGLEVGGDDYLTKPIRLSVLAAKIRVMKRLADMHRALQEKTDLLERYQEENEQEQRMAKHMMEHLVRLDRFQGKEIEHWMVPARHFSGDLIAAAHSPNNTLYVILADATGHGLSAALSGIPVIDVFYAMSQRGFPLSIIAHEMNRKIKSLIPTGKFIAATLAAIHKRDRLIEVWNGSNPTAMFLSETGEVLHSWPSVHPALGVLDHLEFSGETDIFPWSVPGQLWIYSDGLTEAESPTGEPFNEDRLQKILTETPVVRRTDSLRTAVNSHLHGRSAHDDVSVLVINCEPEEILRKQKVSSPSGGKQVSRSFLQWISKEHSS